MGARLHCKTFKNPIIWLQNWYNETFYLQEDCALPSELAEFLKSCSNNGSIPEPLKLLQQTYVSKSSGKEPRENDLYLEHRVQNIKT